MSVRVVDRKIKWDKLEKSLKNIKPKAVYIGINGSARDSDGESVAYYASINEFGAVIKPRAFKVTTYKSLKKSATTSSAFDKYGNKRSIYKKKGRFVRASDSNFAQEHEVSHNGYEIPSRPFMRHFFDNNISQIDRMTIRSVNAFIDGKATYEQMLNAWGLAMQKGIIKSIRTGPWVPNAKSTIRKKGSDKPLIDDRVMESSIQFEIRGPNEGKD